MLINDIENEMTNTSQTDPQNAQSEDERLTAIDACEDGTVENAAPTWINPETASKADLEIEAGEVLCEDYRVVSAMNVSTGEASLYICEKTGDDSGKKYVAKVYRRLHSIKPDVTERLLRLRSDYVAPLYCVGEYHGFSVEVIPYYENGSLNGATLEADEIRAFIVPALNEGLHDLHTNGIIHKDIKPSNIMLNDSRDGVVLIDFGISSVKDSDSTVIVTKTGMTPEYSAPETFRNVFLEESDYYSMGITLYELFCGALPFKSRGADMSDDDAASLATATSLPFPAEMPSDLQELISGLTYFDISNRKDRSNPNRRWTYEDVKKWLEGDAPSAPSARADGKAPPFELGGTQYTSVNDIIVALSKHWSEAKSMLMGKSDALTEYFKPFDERRAQACTEARASIKEGADADATLSALLGSLQPASPAFCWLGDYYEGISRFGESMLATLDSDGDISSYIYALDTGALEAYFERAYSGNDEAIRSIKEVRAMLDSAKDDHSRSCALYCTAYLTSGSTRLKLLGKEFASPDELSSYMHELSEESFDSLREFSYAMVGVGMKASPALVGWSYALGMLPELRKCEERIGLKGKKPPSGGKKGKTKTES